MYSLLLYLAISLFIGYLAIVIARVTGTVYIPYLLILGLIFGPILGIFEGEQIEYLFFNYIGPIGAMFIILAESSKLSRVTLKRVLKPTLALITFVLFVTGIGVAIISIYVVKLPLWAGFGLGAILSSTDPASIIPSLKKARVKEIPSTLLITEAVFNDPFSYMMLIIVIALLLPQYLPYIESSEFTISNPIIYIILSQFVSPILISLGLFFISYELRQLFPTDFKSYYTEILILFGISSYTLTIFFGGSGYMAVAIFGILAGNYMPKDKEKQEYQEFMDKLSSFVVIFVFVFLGATASLVYLKNFLLPGIIIGLALIFVIRPLATILAVSIDRNITFQEGILIGLEGTRGVFPAILSTTFLYLGFVSKDQTLITYGEVVQALVTIIIFLSLTIQPLMLKRIAKITQKF